jgi:hypothetical protein
VGIDAEIKVEGWCIADEREREEEETAMDER